MMLNIRTRRAAFGVLGLLGVIFLSILALSTWVQAQGNDIRYGETVQGEIAPGKTQEWLFRGSGGDIISLNAERLSGDLAPSLLIQELEGQPVAGTQAAEGQTQTALIQVRLPQSGSFLIRVSGAGVSSGTYKLKLTLNSAAASTPTITPTIPREISAGGISAGEPKTGEIGGEVFQQLWRYAGTAGTVVDIRMSPTSGNLESALVILAPTGDVIVNGAALNNGPDAGVMAFVLPFTGDYTIAARRVGQDNGRLGTSSGRYSLLVTVRNAVDPTQNTVLNPGSSVQGRLNTNFPRALYRLDQGGSVAAYVALGRANRLVRLRVFTLTGQLLNEFAGISPLFVPTRLPDRGPFLLEVTAPESDNSSAIDFSLSAFRFNASVNVAHAQPLWYGKERQSSASGIETWYFFGKQGDMLDLGLMPAEPTADSSIRLVGPDDGVLYQANIGAQIKQSFTLTLSGLYEIDVRPTSTLAYRLRVDQMGIAGVSLARLKATMDSEPLAANAATTLNPGSSTARWLDASAGTLLNVGLTAQSGTVQLGLAVEAPDGNILAATISTRELGASLKRLYLEQAGRYRVIVFDPRLQISERDQPIRYQLTFETNSGGALEPGTPVRGGVVETDGLAAWSLTVPAGALINARFTNLSANAWSPTLYIIEPGGQIIASAQAVSGALTATNTVAQRPGPDITLYGVPVMAGGLYQIIAAGLVTGDIAAYELVADSVMPFATSIDGPIQVSATRPPVTRYTAAAASSVERVPIANLITPVVSPSQVPTDQIRTLAFNTTVRGDMARGVPGQMWRLNSVANIVLQLRATALDGTGQAPSITVWDRQGHIVAEQYGAAGDSTLLNYRALQGGQFDVIVTLGLDGGRYILTLEAASITDGALKVLDGTPLVYGQTATAEFMTGDTVNTFYFLGATNDLIALQLNRLTGNFTPSLQITSPSGRVLGEDANAARLPTAGVGNVRLTDNGLYTVRVQRIITDERVAGRYMLNLTLQGGQRLRNQGSGVIQPGQTVQGFLGPDNNENTWLIHGKRGQRVSFTATGSASLAPLGLRVLDTIGNAFASQEAFLNEATIHLSSLMLPEDGVYRVQLFGGAQGVGAYSVTWDSTPDTESGGALRYDETVNGLFSTGKVFENWVFSGTAGDLVTVSLRFVRGDKFNGAFQLRAENGLVLARVADLDDGQGARATVLLPFSGSYSLTIANPDTAYKGAGVYALNLILQDSKARSAGALLRYGQTAQGDLYADDPEDTWIFAAREGEKVRLNLRAQDRFLKPSLELRTPDGQVLASAQPSDKNGLGEAQIGGDAQSDFSIPGNGVYVVAIRGAGDVPTTGSYLLKLDYTPLPVVETRQMAYGDTRPGLIADDRPFEVFLFAGREGDTVNVNLTRESGSNLAAVVQLESADGTILAKTDAIDGDSALIKDFRLPITDQYRIVATRVQGTEGRTSGRYSVRLEGKAQDRTPRGFIRYGQPSTGRLGDDNQVDRLSFDGKAGEILGIVARPAVGDLDMIVRLYSPKGEKLAQADNTGSAEASITSVALPIDGSYTVEITRGVLRSQGGYELNVNRLYQLVANAAPQSLIAYGARLVGSVDVTNAEAKYTIRGSGGDQITVQLLHQADDVPPLLTIIDPSGAILAQGKLGIGRTLIESYTLPISGLYTISIKRPINAQQPFSPFALTVDLVSAQRSQAASAGGVISADGAVTGTFAQGEAAHYWLFQAKAGQSLAIGLLRLTGALYPSALLVGPNGQALTTLTLPGRALSGTIHYRIPMDGLYSILVLPNDSRLTGSYRLTLQPDVADSVEIKSLQAGVPVEGTLDSTTAGNRWAIDAQAGQVISARMLVTGGNLAPALHLLSNDGSILAEGVLDRGNVISATISGFVVPASGTYLLLADRQAEITLTAGSYRLLFAVQSPGQKVSAAAAAARPLAYNQPVRDVIQADGLSVWAIEGKEGDTLNVVVVINDVVGQPLQPTLPPPTRRISPTPPDISPTSTALLAGRVAPVIELQDLSGQVLKRAAPPESGDRSEAEMTSFTLPATGRYLIVLKASTSVTATLVIQKRQTILPVTGTPIGARVLVPKTPLQNGLTNSAPIDFWTFSADQGSVIQIVGTRLNGDLRLDMALFGPSGFITSTTADSTQSEISVGPVRLLVKGTYTLAVSRWLGALGRSAGGYKLVLSFAADASGLRGGAIETFGRPVTGGIAADKLGDTWTFNGNAGDLVEIRMARLDGSLRPAFSLLGPDSTTLLSAEVPDDNTSQVLIRRAILPINGPYAIRATRAGQTLGSYNLTVNRVQTGVQASVNSAEGIEYGNQKSGEINPQKLARAWVFYGKTGERALVEVKAAAESNLDPFVYLLAPDGTILIADDNSGGGLNARLDSGPLPAAGFYAVVVTASPLRTESGSAGAFNLTLLQGSPGASFQGQLNIGDEAGGRLTLTKPIHAWAFEIRPEQAGQAVAARIESNAVLFSGVVRIVKADGQPLASSLATRGGAAGVEAMITAPGWYAVVVATDVVGAQGDYRLKLSYALAPTGGGVLLPGQRGFGQITRADFTDAWRFTLPPTGSNSLTVTRLSNNLDLTIALYGSDGKLIVEMKAEGKNALTLQVPPGSYTVIISRANGPAGQTTGSYTVLVGG